MTWQLIPGILIVLILIVLGLLVFPVIFHIESNRFRGTIDGRISIQWLIIKLRHSLKDNKTEILLFSRRIISFQHKQKPIITKPQDTEESPELPESKKPRKIPPIKSLNIIKPLLRFFRELLATIRFRHLSIDTTYGMEDPGLTGILTGYLHAVKGSSQMGQNFQFTPDFTRSILYWDMSASAAIIPIRIFPPFARFVTNRQVLRSGWEIIRG